MQIPSELAVNELCQQTIKSVKSEEFININGRKVSRAEGHELCRCGHNFLTHVHYNGGLNLPDGVPTYCGLDNCPCDTFRKRQYPTTEGARTQFERKFERIINLFITVEIDFGHILPSDFSDEFIDAVRDARDYCDELNKEIKELKESD